MVTLSEPEVRFRMVLPVVSAVGECEKQVRVSDGIIRERKFCEILFVV